MNFDLRLPIGILFSLFGTILVGLGLTASRESFQTSLGLNINLDWGIVLLLFGFTMLGFVYRSRRKAQQ
jgi:hypothetical protein